LKKLDSILEEAKATREDIVKTTIYISDISLWNVVNALYKQYFGDHKPAWVVVPTKELHFGYPIELEAIASIDE
jgi:2-iminobutanoate/2-iminopropanoate deaminase